MTLLLTFIWISNLSRHWSIGAVAFEKGKAKKCLKIHMKDTSLIPILLKPFFNLFERRQLFCTAAEPDPVH